jgi:hypothetical protein
MTPVGARGATDDDLEWIKPRWIAPPEFARLTEEYDRIVSV